ncbi:MULTISPECIES: AI-2E family transporter [unclassified Leifsonia]|uniref:AI-2E family transporter n=1 Tax=unclassified Leifsonia TaxID=2663824 RepID=UPI000A6161A6|nr:MULTISPECIES: AI-2E family transporter [unclassified Leifsonia]
MFWFGKKKPPVEPHHDLEEAVDLSAPPNRNAMILIGLGGATITGFGLAATQGVVAPIFLALVLTICVHPLRIALERRGVPRGIATVSVVLAVFILLAAFVTALIVAFAQFATLLPQFAPQIQDIGATIGKWLTQVGFGADQVQAIVKGFDPSKLVGLVSGVLGSITNITVALVIILTLLLLMAMDAGYLQTLFRQLRPRRPHMVSALESFAHGVRKYMVATTGLGVAQGVLNWVALLILQVPGALLWGLLSFLCSFIPNVGYFIAIIPPVVFGALVGGWQTAVAIIVIYGVINAIVQSVVQPRIVGNAVALSQTITFASVLVWLVILGPIGAILAVPLTLVVRMILIDSNPNAHWWRPVLGDFDETKVIMKAEDVQAKQAKTARKAAKK